MVERVVYSGKEEINIKAKYFGKKLHSSYEVILKSYVFCHFCTYFINLSVTFHYMTPLSLDRVLDIIYYAIRVLSSFLRTSRARFNTSDRKIQTILFILQSKTLESREKKKSRIFVERGKCHLCLFARSSTQVNLNCNHIIVCCF